MAKDGIIEVEGTVVEILPNTKFIVEIQGGHRLTAYISGKLRDNNIRLTSDVGSAERRRKEKQFFTRPLQAAIKGGF